MSEAGRVYAWAQLRSSWGRRLALALLLGLTGAIAIGAAAGALRTGSAVDRFTDAQRGFDAALFCSPERDERGYTCEQDLAARDGVASVAPVVALNGLLSVSGQNLEQVEDTCYSGTGDVSMVVAPDGRYGTAINTHRFIDGRPADPTKADEVVIPRELARRADLAVGDTIDLQLFAGADCLDDPSHWQQPRALTIVGIEVSPSEIRPESGDYLTFVYGTPALLDEVGDLPDTNLIVAARIKPGHSYEELALDPAADVGVVAGAIPGTLNSDNLKRSDRPYVIALWLVAGLTAAASLILLGQLLSRQIRADAGELRTLGHLGLTKRDRTALGMAHVLTVVLPAALVALVVAYLASSAMPLGTARIIEVDRGLRFDAAALGLGTVVMIVGLVLVSLPSVIVAARQRTTATEPPAGRAGAFARVLGGGPVSTTGLRMAFEPMRGPTAPPLRSGLGVIVAAVTLLVGATVFAGSLTHLLGSKHLIGWNWDALIYVDSEDGGPEVTDAQLRKALAEDPGVAAATPGTIFPATRLFLGPKRQEMQVMSFDGEAIGPTLITGRAPHGPGEIVLGRETLSRLGRHVGDDVDFVALTGDFEEVRQGGGTETPGTLTIVGSAVLPASGGPNRLGTGAAVDFAFYESLLPDVRPDAVFVRLAPGADLHEVVASVDDTLGVEGVQGLTEEILPPQLLDLDQVRNLPIAIAAGLALLAVCVVAQIIIGSTHARRVELGVLRAIGLRPRQIRAAIVVQALAISGAALLIGVPLGIIIGRQAWRVFALSLGTKPEASVAVAWLVALAAGLLVLASLLALIGSARHRRRLTTALRTE